MSWEPVGGAHAIERVRIVVQLESEVPSKMRNLLGTIIEGDRDRLALGPRREVSGQVLNFQIGPQGAVSNQIEAKTGWEFHRSSDSPVPVEALSLQSDTLSYEIGEYSRWQLFLDRFNETAGAILPKILEFSDISVLSMEYYDRFVFSGDPDTARPSDLISVNDSILGEGAIAGEDLWHIHRGWFEQGEFGRILMNQNMDAQEAHVNGVRKRSVQILTKADARSTVWGFSGTDIEPHLNALHDHTKKLFALSLNDDVRKQLKIFEE